MQTNREEFGGHIFLPDSGNARLKRTKRREDVVLHAPTGAGKTFVLNSNRWRVQGQAVYTCPPGVWLMINSGMA